MKLRRASKVNLLSLLSIDWNLAATTSALLLLLLSSLFWANSPGDVNFILNNGSTELTAEQVQRPALEIEANLQPAATLHINHAPTSTLAKSLPETTLGPGWLCRTIEDERS